jgi:DNA polymerase elongation subunit (family B)
VDLVSGWSDDTHVYLVERPDGGDAVKVRRMRAKWSAFFTGLDDKDRLALQRTREVIGLSTQGQYTRVDFRNKWARKDICWKLGQAIEGARAAGALDAAILEADVNPLRRFLSDYGTANVSTSPRCAWFDLETDSRRSFLDATEHGTARILCWSIATLVDGESRMVASGLLEADTDEAERRLIEDFLDACRSYDVLLAWSGDGFDFPVLALRADKLRAKQAGMRPLWNRWCWLDCLEVFKKYHAHVHESGEEKTSFKLNNIAQVLCGEGKKEFAVSRTWESWAAGGEERQRLLLYNQQDTLLMPKIEARTGYVALHVAVCSVTRCFPDSRSLMASQQGDGFLLRLGEIHGHRWPTKKGVENVEQYSGAYVMEPSRTGIIENVHVADFAALYPSIMRSWNISPETALWQRQPDPQEGSCRLPYSDLVRFSKAARGMFPRALDDLVVKRAEYSRRQDAAEPGSDEWERYKRLSGAYKIVANSFYGIMGSPYARFFSSTAAEAVTQTGAWLIKRVAAASKEKGLDAFYGDTDSCFVSGDSGQFAEVVRGLNESWRPLLTELGCDDCHIKLEFEKSFNRIVLVSAKRYIGRFSIYKGKQVSGKKVEVKGLEYKRGDTMRFARTMQKELIDLLLGDEVPSLDVVREFVAGWKDRVLNGVLTVEDIVLSQSVKGLDEYAERYTVAQCSGSSGTGKKKRKCGYNFGSTVVVGPGKCPRCGTERKQASPPVHVRVAKVLEERGEEIRAGTRIEYLIVSDEGDRIDAVPARDEGALAKINRHYYWNSRIYPPTARVLESAFPSEDWVETKAQKKERRKLAAIEKNRGVSGPLFDWLARTGSESSRVVITIDRDLDGQIDMAALKSVLVARRGDRPVMLKLVDASGEQELNLMRYPVQLDDQTILELERICGRGSVSFSTLRGN